MIWGERRVKIIQLISPIIICYGLGLLLANFSFFEVDRQLSTSMVNVMVPLAIPLLLLSTNIVKWLKGAKGAVVSFMLCILSVLISSTVAVFLFQDQIPESWKLAGMLVGVYTGGTPNMNAIGLSLGVKEETFILLNASDMLMSSLYLLFLLTFAKPLFSKFFPQFKAPLSIEDFDEEVTFRDLSRKRRAKNATLLILLSFGILLAAVGLSFLIYGKIGDVFVILFVTTLGVAFSFIGKLNKLLGSQEVGEYFLLVFCFALGSIADIGELMNSASDALQFNAFLMFGAILLHYIMAYFARIDSDTVIITSVAGIFGPAFIGPVAKAMKNKSIVLIGMTTGLVGYAFSNYLGIGFALFLKNWF
nr:DUF819 family protein [Xanthovirga aplysinae]